MSNFMMNASTHFLILASFFSDVIALWRDFLCVCIFVCDIWREISLCTISGLRALESIRKEVPPNLPEYPRTIRFFYSVSEGYKREAPFQTVQLRYCCQTDHLRPLHYDYMARKNTTGKIVILEPAELSYSCKRISSYKADKKRSKVFMCPKQNDTEIRNN